MYDVQLAYMVVAHSQRDPGEYLMELQHLVAAPSASLRHHAMDMHLGRFDKALQHLVAAGPEHFPKALQLARAKVRLSCISSCLFLQMLLAYSLVSVTGSKILCV